MKENGSTLKRPEADDDIPQKLLNHTALLANKPTQAKSLLHSLEQATEGIDLHVDADKTIHVFNQKGDISTLNSSSLKLVDKFMYLGSCISSTENDINMCLVKAWTVINRLSIIWKSNLSDKTERDFFQVAVVISTVWMCHMDAD